MNKHNSCGFDSHSWEFIIICISTLPRQNSQCLENSAWDGERSVFILASICLPHCYRRNSVKLQEKKNFVEFTVTRLCTTMASIILFKRIIFQSITLHFISTVLFSLFSIYTTLIFKDLFSDFNIHLFKSSLIGQNWRIRLLISKIR